MIGFGRFAGYAGMIDGLRGLGDRMLGLGYSSPFLNMGYTDSYASLSACRSAVQLVGDHIQIGGVPRDLAPLIFAFTGMQNGITRSRMTSLCPGFIKIKIIVNKFHFLHCVILEKIYTHSNDCPIILEYIHNW